jgi:hypothetical protein
MVDGAGLQGQIYALSHDSGCAHELTSTEIATLTGPWRLQPGCSKVAEKEISDFSSGGCEQEKQ